MSHLHPEPIGALAALGDPTADNQFLVATAAGVFAYESDATARSSLGVAIGTDVQAYSAALGVLAALPFTADGEFLVGTGAGTAQLETGNTARTSLGLGTGDSPTFTNMSLTGSMQIAGDLLVGGDTVQMDVSKVITADNAILLNGEYTTAVAQDLGLAGVYLPTATNDVPTAYPTATTITTTGSDTFTAGDYINLTGCGTNNGLYRVLTHTGTTLTIATTGDDLNLINTSLDTTSTTYGTITNVGIASLRFDGSATSWEVAHGNTGPLSYTSLSGSVLGSNNTWTGTNVFQDEITTEAVKRKIVLLTSATATYTVLGSDHVIVAQRTSGGQLVVSLPAATGSGRELIIKRSVDDTQKVQLDGNAAEEIDGAITETINTAGGALTILDAATGEWIIV